MIIRDLDLLEVIPEANQGNVIGSFAWARTRVNAKGRFTRTFTYKYSNSDSNGSVAIARSYAVASS